jgi:hypothetical protein
MKNKPTNLVEMYSVYVADSNPDFSSKKQMSITFPPGTKQIKMVTFKSAGEEAFQYLLDDETKMPVRIHIQRVNHNRETNVTYIKDEWEITIKRKHKSFANKIFKLKPRNI